MIDQNIYITHYSSHFKEKVICLLKYMWKSLDYNERVRKFEWRYENNPYEKELVIYLAIDDEKVVGFRPLVVQHFILNGSRLRVLSGADVIIHPEYRNRKIWTKINQYYFKDINNSHINTIDLTLSAGKNTALGSIKQGWQFMTDKMIYSYKVFFPSIMTAALDKKKTFMTDKFFQCSDDKYNFILSNKLEAKEMSFLNSKINHFDTIKKDRNEKYFLWKYSYEPQLYSYIYLRKGATLSGYVVLKRLSRCKASIEEYSVPDIIIFQKMINIAAKQLKISIFKFLVLSDHQRKLSRGCWFLEENAIALKVLRKERFPALIRPVKPEPLAVDFLFKGIDIRNTGSWELYPGDIH